MPGHARAPLDRRAQHRVAAVQVDGGFDFLDLGGREELGVDAVEPVGVHAPLGVAHVLQGVCARFITPRWLNITL